MEMQTYAWTCTLIMIVFASSVELRTITNDTGIAEDSLLKDLINGCTTSMYTCETGTPVQNPAELPSTNGCGAYGITFTAEPCPYLNDCCDQHDFCYGKCGSNRAVCDQAFKNCTQSTSDSDCKSAGELMYKAVDLAGCEAFSNSQKRVCICK
jgi:hypothetical protein